MGTALLRTTLLYFPILFALNAHAARGTLLADGILRVKGADLSTATITVVPNGAPAYMRSIQTREFDLSLPLNDTYLISFSREGCPVKEVYFDTSVPVDHHAALFSFPFQVTLDHVGPERMFAYAGPVGFVRYMHELKDFGYETQYVVKVNDELHERMREMQATGMDPKRIAAPTAAVVLTLPRGGRSTPAFLNDMHGGTLAPTVSHVPALVHVLGERAEASPTVARTVPVIDPEVLSADVAGALDEVERPIYDTAQTSLGTPLLVPVPILRTASVRLDARIEEEAPVVHLSDDATAVLAARWEEETIMEPRRVTHVLRELRSNGTVNEFRKVQHAYGAVFYFHNTTSISEHTFQRSVHP